MLQVRCEFAGKRLVELFPDMAGPTRSQCPFRQIIIDDNMAAGSAGDDLSRLDGAIEGRGHHRGVIGKMSCNLSGLPSPGDRERESGEVGVDHVIGVVDLAVSNEEDAGAHGVHLIESTGTVEA